MSRLKNILTEATGSGWGEHKPGGKVNSVSDVEKGEYLLFRSPDLNAENIGKVVDVTDDKMTILFMDPKDLMQKRMASDKPFVIWDGAAVKHDKIFHMAK